ncbi:PhnB protein homolog [Mycetohabitans rhizoxinica HKI 454]|uniref:PhnB protein homolog n=1 Tax=Mycetohabitans rhizoxinica (strain DSM 19002 / CIP 109453 / HKI 454) TaxID=882378 RepID=E5AT80_MYCRK|nr:MULTISPECIES: PhnB protein [Mycetohabitans]MCF7696349.1 hypothetical protein [Mycetohabitans sp. B2]MCG1047682.1 hypothetical protein [Mycetohabitans sp. B6]CBW75754.1 PhnB protein homolog [Mycetohabitans rhizoxinica HKI 454]
MRFKASLDTDMPGIPCPNYRGLALSINTDDLAGGQQIFDALTDEGNVMMPFGATLWSTGFDMLLTNRFGIGGMVSAPHPG